MGEARRRKLTGATTWKSVDEAMDAMGIGSNNLNIKMMCKHLEGIDDMIADPGSVSDDIRAGAYNVLTQLTSVLLQRTVLSKRRYVAIAPIAVAYPDESAPEDAAYIREMLPKVRRDVAGYLEQFFAQAPVHVRQEAMNMIPQPRD